jgi:hypothetical protein
MRKYADCGHAEVPFCCWFLVDHASQHGRVHITTTPTSAPLVSWLTHCTPQMTTMVKQLAVQVHIIGASMACTKMCTDSNK